MGRCEIIRGQVALIGRTCPTGCFSPRHGRRACCSSPRGGWLVVQAVGSLAVVVAPLAVAVLLAAMLRPLVDKIAVVLPRSLAALGVILLVIAVVVGGLSLVTTQVASGLPEMRDRLHAGADSVLAWLSTGPLHLTADRLQAGLDQARSVVSTHSTELTTGALAAGQTALDAVAGTLICLIALFFFLYHGEMLWAFFVRWLPAAGRHDIDRAFREGWSSLGAYTRMQLVVAAINATGIGIGAAVLGVPFLVPIVVIVFLGSFIPIIGALLSGLVPALIALVDKGPWVALAMIVVVVVVHQIESHVLQPFLMGHAVALHPLAVIVVVTSGTYLLGIGGALFAVPVAAMVNAMVRYLAGATVTLDAEDPGVSEHHDDGASAAVRPRRQVPRPNTRRPRTVAGRPRR